MRYVIEGEWSGYTSSQQRVCHRRVTEKQYVADWIKETPCIRFTDGTSLYLTVRPCTFREKVKEIRGYDSLLDDCRYYKCNDVSKLADAKKARQCADAFKPLAEVAAKKLGVPLS